MLGFWLALGGVDSKELLCSDFPAGVFRQGFSFGCVWLLFWAFFGRRALVGEWLRPSLPAGLRYGVQPLHDVVGCSDLRVGGRGCRWMLLGLYGVFFCAYCFI